MSIFQFVIRHSSIVILFLLLLSLGCHKKPSPGIPVPEEEAVAASPVPAAITPEVPESTEAKPTDPIPPAKTAAEFDSFDLGEADFYAGNYQQAALSLESYLSRNPESEKRDQALFLIALSRGFVGGSSRNRQLSETALKQLISEFPDSPYRKQAEYILDLTTQIEGLKADVEKRNDIIKELSEELKRLKQIDLQRRPRRD